MARAIFQFHTQYTSSFDPDKSGAEVSKTIHPPTHLSWHQTHPPTHPYKTHGTSFKPPPSQPPTHPLQWWVQVLHEEDDIGLHFDKDYTLEDQGLNIHPHLATVTYLTPYGGPTLILPLPGPLHHGGTHLLPTQPSTLYHSIQFLLPCYETKGKKEDSPTHPPTP